MGTPFDEEIQTEILLAGLKYLKKIDTPGTIVDLAKAYGGDGGKCLVCRVG
jgi:hypothetical protein